MMAAIRDQFKPTDIATKRDILAQYRRYTKLQNREIDVDKWLMSLETTFDDGKRNKGQQITVVPNGPNH
jgi:hypothetical protein